MRPINLINPDPPWPPEEPEDDPDLLDDAASQLDDEHFEALIPDDDYEPLPEHGDFWTEDG